MARMPSTPVIVYSNRGRWKAWPLLSAPHDREIAPIIHVSRAPLCLNPAPLLVLVALLLLAGCGRRGEVVHLHGDTMGTSYNIAVANVRTDRQREALQETVDEVLAQVDAHLSTYRSDSEISVFNARTDTAWFKVSQPLYDVLAAAQAVSARTNGAFDISVGPLVKLWGFAEGAGLDWVAPAPDAIEAARAALGWEKLELRSDPRAVRKRVASLRVNVGAIAPGYAVDLIAQRFRTIGAGDYLIEIGGEVLAGGRGPAGRPWRVAVEAPLAGERRPYAIIELNNAGVSTSGDYRDFRVVDGRRVSHTIDPRTGRPVTHRLTSVTVVHDSAMLADAYATALMVLGPSAGYELAAELKLAALFIERGNGEGEFSERATPEFAPFRRQLP